jgi:DNA-binding MarR family transcriptional regulator
MDITKTEARILIYLKHAKPELHYIMAISQKLCVAYNYTSQILNQMEQKGWVKKQKSEYRKSFYFLTGKADLKEAALIAAEIKKETDKQLVFFL